MTILWWQWLVLGLVLIAAEMAAAGGFYIIFFGLAATIVGLLAGSGLAGPTWMQILLFSVLSVGGLVLFRARLLRWLQVTPQSPPVDSLVGEIGIVAMKTEPGGVGKVELRGTTWSARNAASLVLDPGMRVRVVGVEGLMLHVEPEGSR